MMHYPENSEYDYLSWVAWCDRVTAEEQVLDPVRDRYWDAYRKGDRAAATELWEQADKIRAELVEQMRRREDIVEWLYWDSKLREEGKTYADIYEGAPEAKSCTADEF